MKIEFVSIISDETVVGSNPEFADMSNPSGLLYGKIYQVEAVTAKGRRFFHRFTSEERSARLEKLAAQVDAVKEINLEHWAEGYEVYGSDAWQEADNARARAWNSDPVTCGTVRDY